MRAPQWIKKLGGHAGELYVAAELSKRGIPNALLPENFSGDDIMIGKKDGSDIAFIQVKSCHPDRADSFILHKNHERWIDAADNQFVIFVWLGSPKKNESPRYWIAPKKDVGEACLKHPEHGTDHWDRRFFPQDSGPDRVPDSARLNPKWEDNWGVFKRYIVLE